MAQQNTYIKPAWNVFDLKKLRLTGKPWNAEDKFKAPAISLHVVNGNPRFRLYMNNGGNSNSHPIAFDPYIFSSLLEALREITNSVSADKLTMRIRVSFDKGQRLEKPIVSSTVTVGRDTDGIVYLAVQIKGEPLAIFQFLPSYFAELVGADGEVLPTAKASTIAARGWANLVEKMVPNYLVMHTTDPDIGKDPKQSSGKPYGTSSSAKSDNWESDFDVPF